jgi:dTDP-4-amino-4,6-dideoxygalactose transaminase
MALTNDHELAEKLRSFERGAKRFSRKRVFISLLNPVFWKVITPLYYFGVGKFTVGRIFTGLAHLFSLFGNMIEKSEYKTVKPDWFPAKLPAALAVLGSRQFSKLNSFNAHRSKIAAIYNKKFGQKESAQDEKHTYLRYPLLVSDRDKLLRKAKGIRAVLGDWYKTILYSPEKNLTLFSYKKGSCRNAEKYSRDIVNLPTGVNVSTGAAEKIADLVLEHNKDAGKRN